MHFFIKKIKIFIFLFVFLLSSCNTYKNDDIPYDLDLIENEINRFLLDKDGELTINIILPPNIYLSDKELFYDFVSELYNFSLNRDSNSKTHLAHCGVKSLDDAIHIFKTWTGGDRGMPKVGIAFGNYFLRANPGSTFNDQRNTKTFVAYCLKNDRFIDFLYYMKTFFYHWRIDEGYAGPRYLNKDPNGTDFFAYPDASIIDTAKFFYFYNGGLPLRIAYKGNIARLYNEVPGIIKNHIKTTLVYRYGKSQSSEYVLPSEYDCYGFNFQGYYLTPDFKGSSITAIEKFEAINAGDSIDLYAKFERCGKYADEYLHDLEIYLSN